MLKITKGLKKKKKGKKSKHKEEELFKPEELEAYRQQQAEKAAASGGGDDEWKKFQALTADIDSVLKKTQGDLDRIKSTSFFQRKPTASEVKKAEETAAAAEAEELHQQQIDETRLAAPTAGVVELSETESEEEDEDDIFDTTFVDAVASGEVKLAYIPESPPEEEAEGDDPFDTSIAERAILGPAFNKKGKKLVPLGSAVEVLTGRVQLPTCAIPRNPANRRVFQQQRDLLLGSFDADDNGNTAKNIVNVEYAPVAVTKNLLDDDEPLPIDVPIDLSGVSLHQVIPQEITKATTFVSDAKNDILSEFDVLKNEEEDDEFAQLAAESITKKPVAVLTDLPIEVPVDIPNCTFDVQFDEIKNDIVNTFEVEFEEDIDDPFDTTFADNILPGKAELKIIEDEILNAASDIQQVEEKFSDRIISKVSIHVTNPVGERESVSSLDRVDEASLNSIKPIHRDLLGGSNTDLSKICDEPIKPDQTTEESFSDYSDPFDTSSVDQISAPGQAELKFLEKELLGDGGLPRTLSDPDFNPRDVEVEKQAQRPVILEVNAPKVVKFTTPTVHADLLGAGDDEHEKHKKPLTPYYVRENSIPECVDVNKDEEVIEDPFDTSFIAGLAPGKAELKLLEDEFAKPVIVPVPELKRQLSDDDFDPRAGCEPVIAPVITSVPARPQLPTLPVKEIPKPDLFAVDDDITAKALTPAVEKGIEFELSYSDPFDTSIASNILPGKAELKLLEDELISAAVPIKRNLTDPEFDPRTIENTQQVQPQQVNNIEDIFGQSHDQSFVKPLTPYADNSVAFQVGDEEDIDPFDTSIADNIAPGRTELKLLESELI